jgi:WD40 repeat protein
MHNQMREERDWNTVKACQKGSARNTNTMIVRPDTAEVSAIAKSQINDSSHKEETETIWSIVQQKCTSVAKSEEQRECRRAAEELPAQWSARCCDRETQGRVVHLTSHKDGKRVASGDQWSAKLQGLVSSTNRR